MSAPKPTVVRVAFPTEPQVSGKFTWKRDYYDVDETLFTIVKQLAFLSVIGTNEVVRVDQTNLLGQSVECCCPETVEYHRFLFKNGELFRSKQKKIAEAGKTWMEFTFTAKKVQYQKMAVVEFLNRLQFIKYICDVLVNGRRVTEEPSITVPVAEMTRRPKN